MNGAQVELTRRICALIYAIGGKFLHPMRNLEMKYNECVRILRKISARSGKTCGNSNMWLAVMPCTERKRY